MKQALPAAARGKPLEIWFQDEARIGQKGTLTRIWARLGSRPPGPRDSRYEWAYIFAAVCPERATGAALVMPYANTEAMNLHLQEISRGVAPGAHAALIFDGAGWHTTDKLELPENITPVCLPPYAPELNPTENIWEYLRKNYLALRVFDDYDAIVDACCMAWNDPCLSGLHPHPLGLEWAQTGYRGARHGCSRPRRSPIPAFATRVPATFPR